MREKLKLDPPREKIKRFPYRHLQADRDGDDARERNHYLNNQLRAMIGFHIGDPPRIRPPHLNHK